MEGLITVITNAVLVKSALAPWLCTMPEPSSLSGRAAPREAPCSPSSCSEQRETTCSSALFHHLFKSPTSSLAWVWTVRSRCQSCRRLQAASRRKHFKFLWPKNAPKKKYMWHEEFFCPPHPPSYTYIAVYKCLKSPWKLLGSDILTSSQHQGWRVTDLLQTVEKRPVESHPGSQPLVVFWRFWVECGSIRSEWPLPVLCG